MENNNILKTSEYLFLNKTPVIIVDTMVMTDRNNLIAQRELIFKWLKGFNNAIDKGSYHDYLNLYDNSYLPKISWWNNWFHIRGETKKNIGDFSVVISNKGIYKQDDVYIIIFHLGLNLKDQNINFGVRKLFVINKDNTYKIIGDEYQYLEEKLHKNKSPLVATAKNLVKKLEQGPDIQDK